MIKIDIEMPESCWECGRWSYRIGCYINGHNIEFSPFLERNLKSKDCPLIEVEE